jgi:hypothetical protein
MNARLSIAAIALLAAPWSAAQKVAQEPQEDPVQAAIREFNSRDSKAPNEVSVVLPPEPEPLAASPEPEAVKPEPVPETPPKAPVLVTGTAPAGIELVEETSKPAPPVAELPAIVPEEPAPKPRQGLAVRVEKLKNGTGNIDPSQVKLLAPFPAKPLAQAPGGWHLEASESAPPLTRDVELAPGKNITLTIRPHLLVPDTDGAGAFTVEEPGFDPALGYRQNATVGAVLSQSIQQLDDDSKQLGNVIDNLQQLLVSLPKPEATAAPQPPAAAPMRKR